METLAPSSLQHQGSTQPTKVRGVSLITLVQHCDARGPLAVLGQDAAQLPFPPARIFFTSQTNDLARGAHAHRVCEQILICASGQLKVLVSDGEREETFCLSGPNQALHLGAMVWSEQFEYAPETVLMVLASHSYDEVDYLREEVLWRRELRL